MRSSPKRFPPKWHSIVILLLVWGSIWLCIYLFMLQPLGGIISQKYAAISGGIGLLFTLPLFGLMWLRPDIIGSPTRETLVRIFFQTLFFCLVVWFVLPLTRNIILAPTTNISLGFQGEKNGYVDIIWLRSGLGDIPFQSLKLDHDGQIKPDSFRINLDKDGRAELSWSGRVWKQVSLVMETSHPLTITSSINNETAHFNLDPTIQRVYEMVLPIKKEVYYNAINLLVLPFFFITVGYFFFLLTRYFGVPSVRFDSLTV